MALTTKTRSGTVRTWTRHSYRSYPFWYIWAQSRSEGNGKVKCMLPGRCSKPLFATNNFAFNYVFNKILLPVAMISSHNPTQSCQHWKKMGQQWSKPFFFKTTFWLKRNTYVSGWWPWLQKKMLVSLSENKIWKCELFLTQTHMVSMDSSQCPLSKHFLLTVLQQIIDLLVMFKVDQKELGRVATRACDPTSYQGIRTPMALSP